MRRKLSAFVALVGLMYVAGLPLACGTSTSAPESTDTDGDGLTDRDELVLYKTSPLLEDTDGDGWSDYAEVIDFAFDPEHAPYRYNPRIADLPQLAIVFTSPPLLTIEMTDTAGEQWSVETRLVSENSVTVTTSTSASESQSDSISTPTEIVDEEQVSGTIVVVPEEDAGDGDAGDADAKAEAGDAPSKPIVELPEIDVTRELTVTRRRAFVSGYEPTSTVEASITVSEELAQQYAQALELAESYARSREITMTSGRILITATVENRGNVAFRVINLLLSATMLNAPPAITPVGNLHLDAERYSDFQPFTLAPGEVSAPMNFVRFDLTLEATRAIFRNAQALRIELGVFEINDATGRAYAFTIGDARAKTALVLIDYGGRRPSEWHHVATRANPSRTSLPLREAFEDILRIPFETSWSGLSTLRDVGPGYWTITVDSDDGSGFVKTTTYDATIEPYDISMIELFAGDTVQLVYQGP